VTKFFFKINFLLTVVTIVYCMVAGVSYKETIVRAVMVFAGLYAIMFTFFIGLRMILVPKSGRGKDIEQRRSG